MQRADGLIVRPITPKDKASLSKFYVDTFSEAYGEDEASIGPWADDLLADNHPTVHDADVFVVVDPAQDEQLVSATMLIPQVWRYEDIEIPVGRPELVATHKDYRNRGLVRELFDAVHERSAALGHTLQVITGIPYFYRQFGYAMAVELGSSFQIPLYAVPEREGDQEPDYTVRRATMDDIPTLMRWYNEFAAKHLLTVVRDRAIWEYELTGRSPQTERTRAYYVVVRKDGTEVGYVLLGATTQFGRLLCLEWYIGAEDSYLRSYDDTLRGMKAVAQNFEGEKPNFLQFDSALYHTLKPFVDRKRTWNTAVNPTTYTWYLRVADLPAFIRSIAPVLERRLEGSLANCFTGEVAIDLFSRQGLYMRFERGRLAEVDDRQPAVGKDDAGFPFHMFLNLMFGHRSIDEMGYILPDVYANRKAHVLLGSLFPTKASWLAPID
ncbi:MAG: GNAT family N-acetyltransferase [Anaerolineales bacterium]|nr:GNAT family N-acetyltransferase [Anaerolineales bacterium]